jgi:hypothetical protein
MDSWAALEHQHYHYQTIKHQSLFRTKLYLFVQISIYYPWTSSKYLGMFQVDLKPNQIMAQVCHKILDINCHYYLIVLKFVLSFYPNPNLFFNWVCIRIWYHLQNTLISKADIFQGLEIEYNHLLKGWQISRLFS